MEVPTAFGELSTYRDLATMQAEQRAGFPPLYVADNDGAGC